MPQGGKRWRVWWREMFVASAFWRGARGRFMPPVMTETLPASLLEGLEAAWAFFDGVVRRLVVDNLTPAVTRPDRYTPGLNRVFLEYAQYRGFVVDPGVPEHPTGKPRVERGIPYARQDFFRGEQFLDVADMQARAVSWCRDLAGTRVHGTTRQVPRVVFDAMEHSTLLPLAPEPFDRPTWAWATAHGDHHVQFRRALYSAPTRYGTRASRSARTRAWSASITGASCRAPESFAHHQPREEDSHVRGDRP